MKNAYTVYRGYRIAKDLDTGMTVHEVAERYQLCEKVVKSYAYKIGFIKQDRIARAIDMFEVKDE